MSQEIGEARNVRTLTRYEMVSMGLDSGSTSDKHRASNPTTVSILVIFVPSVPFVTEFWISVSCVSVNLNATNSGALHSGCSHGSGADRSTRWKSGEGAFNSSGNLIASGSW